MENHVSPVTPRTIHPRTWDFKYSNMVFANLLLCRRPERAERDHDDGNDHIDSDTPRSGVATPQPDPSDKRLPGIMHSYFGQVGAGSFTCPSSAPKSIYSPPVGSIKSHQATTSTPLPEPKNMGSTEAGLPVVPDSSSNESVGAHDSIAGEIPPSSNEGSEFSHVAKQSEKNAPFHSYPTPPVSKSPSLHKLKLSESSPEDKARRMRRATLSSSAHHKSISESIPSNARRASLLPLSSVVTTSNVLAAHFSNPSETCPATAPSTPVHSRLNSHLQESPSYDRLKKLTDEPSNEKSIPPTPTRALSNNTAKSDASGGSDSAPKESKGQNGNASKLTEEVLSVPVVPSTGGTSAAPAPPTKGKLTVKITEARGLRKCREPYVVAVFQRNELVSKGPLPEAHDEHEDVTSSPMGGIPITRTGSDSGRPMAIPMKSRQSSNTSLSDYRDFTKNKGRKSFTNPKWDTEAIL